MGRVAVFKGAGSRGIAGFGVEEFDVGTVKGWNFAALGFQGQGSCFIVEKVSESVSAVNLGGGEEGRFPLNQTP